MPLPNPSYQLQVPFEALVKKITGGYSPLVCVVGDETGIGKSRVALRGSELIYWRTYQQKWNMKESVFFSMKKFKQELFKKQGQVLIIEEAEVELGSDEWQSVTNKWFSRIKDTQRVKGNVYFIVLPMLMALARKHRRRINYIADVKARGVANWYKIKKRSAQLLGDELSKSYIGSTISYLPDCDAVFDIIDRKNKARIEKEQGKILDDEIRYKELQRQSRIRKMEKVLGIEPTKTTEEKRANLYTYRCHACEYIFNSEKSIDKVIKCKNCGKQVFIDIQNLIQSPESKLS